MDPTPAVRELRFLPVNDVPVVDLDFNNSVAPGGGFSTTFTENGGRVSIADGDAFLSDVDGTHLSELPVQITNQLANSSQKCN